MKRLGPRLLILALFATSSGYPQHSGGDAQAEARQGMAALESGNFSEAEDHLTRALKADPGQVEVRANLGIAYYADRKYPEAVEAFSQALKTNPALQTARAFLPLSLAGANRCEEAVSGLRSEFASNPDVKLQRILGLSLQRCLIQTNQQAEADKVAQQLLARYPDDVDVLYEAGQMYGKLSSSIYLRLMQIAPHTARGYQLMAEVSAAQDNWPAAMNSYRHALKLEPGLPGAHLRLAVLMLEHPAGPDDWKQALDELNAELRLDPASAEAEYEIGEAYRKHSQSGAAIAAFRKAMQLDPRFAEPRLGLAKVLREQHRTQDALAVLEPARDSAPTNAAVHFLLAQLYRETGRAAEAEREQAIFRQLQPTAAPLTSP
ncbi:MAG TPA: tetratricopeptide repeat protein [Steroidobacteraceae bacterium]